MYGIRYMSDASVRAMYDLAQARGAPSTKAAIQRELARRGIATPIEQQQLRIVA